MLFLLCTCSDQSSKGGIRSREPSLRISRSAAKVHDLIGQEAERALESVRRRHEDHTHARLIGPQAAFPREGDHSVPPHADAEFGKFIAVSGVLEAKMKDVRIVQLNQLCDPDAML